MSRHSMLALLAFLAVAPIPTNAAPIWLSDFYETAAVGTSLLGNLTIVLFDQVPTAAGCFVRFKRVACRFVMSSPDPPAQVQISAACTASGSSFRLQYVALPQALTTGGLVYIINQDVDFLISAGIFPQVRVIPIRLAHVTLADCTLIGTPVP